MKLKFDEYWETKLTSFTFKKRRFFKNDQKYFWFLDLQYF